MIRRELTRESRVESRVRKRQKETPPLIITRPGAQKPTCIGKKREMVCQIEDSDVKKNTLSYVPHLTLPLPRTSLIIIIITLLLLSLSPLTLHSLSLSLLQVPTLSNPFQPPPSHRPPKKQNKRNPKHGVNNSLTFKIVVSYWAVPYLLGILSSTPVGGTPYPTAPCWQRWQPLLPGLVRESERGGFRRGDFFCRRVRMRVIVSSSGFFRTLINVVYNLSLLLYNFFFLFLAD